MATKLAEPSLSMLFDTLCPLEDLLVFVDDDRKKRLAPVLLRRVADILDVDVVIVPQGHDGLEILSSEILGVLEQVLGHTDNLDQRLEALDHASGLLGKLDSRVYQELQRLPL